MIETTIARSGQESTTEPQPGYGLRGLGLFELHQGEVLAGYQGGGRWLIPSGTVGSRLYEVRVGTRPERSRCECVGYQQHKHCSHIVCAAVARKRSAICDGCGGRFRHRQLVEVTEDHESLTWFPGDRLCRHECAGAHGIL